MVKRRVFVSVPVDSHLDDDQRKLVVSIIRLIGDNGFEAQRFMISGLPASMGWNFKTVEEVMKRCVGAVIIAFPRWIVSPPDSNTPPAKCPTEWNHYEGAVANTLGLPTLIITTRGIADRGIVWTGGGRPIVFAPEDADTGWLGEDTFRHRFSLWLDELKERRDVFLGYCGKAKDTANAINLFLKDRLGATILDWSEFSAGGNILDEIERASSLCSSGIFLFTQDDMLEEGEGDRAAPRDNVVFEAGYFTQAKGRERVLIIREQGAKMPADVGGNIYLPLTDRRDISRIETQLRTFIERRL